MIGSRRRWLIIGVVGSLAVLGGVLAGPYLPDWTELRDFACLKLSPSRFKRGTLRRLTYRDRDVLLVGTIHAMHLSTPGYDLADLDNLVRHFEPDRIAIEARPADLADGQLALAPIEMAQLAVLAQARAIPVFGFDAWDERGFEQAAESGQPLDLNDAERNRAMFRLLDDGLGTARRIAVFTGYSHVEPLADLLVQAGAVEVTMDPEARRELFAPAGGRRDLDPMLQAPIERAIERLQGYLARYDKHNAWSDRVRDKLALLQSLRAKLAR